MRKKDTKAQYHQTRRQFLNMMGLGSLVMVSPDPLSILVRSMTDGLIAKAQAQSAGVIPRNYVVALHYGAPFRWVFDNFLRPQGPASSFIKNRGMNNYLTTDMFAPNDNANLDYRDALIDLGGGRSIYLPIMWGGPIPTSDRGMVPMASILNNTMLVRGIDMEVDIGHASGPALVTRVSDAAPSLSGLVADSSARPIPAISLTKASILGGYKSSKGTSLAHLEANATNTMSRIIEPFTLSDPLVLNSSANRAKMQSLIDQAMGTLGNYAMSSKFGADALYKDRNNAEALFQRNLSALVTEYSAAVTRYAKLGNECGQYLQGIIPAGKGLPAWTSGLYAGGGGEGFAAAEVLIKHGMTSTVTFGLGGNAWSIYGHSNYNDEHRQTDRSTPVLVHSHQFRCVAAWLNEFRRALGPELFKETLVHVSAEYGRNPDDSGGGSDHAPGATSMTFFSGAITQPTFIGNIRVNSGSGVYMGTWGTGAAVQTNDGTRGITKKHIGAGVADILRVARPTNDKPVFTLENERVVSLAEAPKNV
jgi:hypothetical protein